MRICVYTAVFGGYDALVEPDESISADVDFICFTDDAYLATERWDVRLVAPAFSQDPVRSARMIKILGHPDLESYEASLYIDASVRLRDHPKKLVDDWLRGSIDLALPAHSYREQVLDEFDEVVRLDYDDRNRVYEQLLHYDAACPDVLAARPLWTALLVRRHTPRVAAAMRSWADHVLRYSRRDQLSVLVALTGHDLDVRVIEIDNYASRWHEWPVIGSRRIAQGKVAPYSVGPMLAELRRARRSIGALERQLTTLETRSGELGKRALELEREVTDGVEERKRLEARIASLTGIRGAFAAVGAAFRAKAIRVFARNPEPPASLS